MKSLKILGLAAVLTAALMVFASNASATSVTATTGGASATPTIHFVNENGHLVFMNAIANTECASTFEGAIESHGAGVPAGMNLSTFFLTGCTNSWHYTTIAAGALEFRWTSGHNGTVVWTGSRLTSTRFGVTCNYETNNTNIGTITGGSPATIELEATLPIASGSSFLCGSGNVKWSGGYVATSALYVAP